MKTLIAIGVFFHKFQQVVDQFSQNLNWKIKINNKSTNFNKKSSKNFIFFVYIKNICKYDNFAPKIRKGSLTMLIQYCIDLKF